MASEEFRQAAEGPREVPLDQVAMLAGHSSLDVTKRYTTPSMTDLQVAVDRAMWE